MLYAGLPTGGALASLVSLLASGKDWRVVFVIGGLAPLVSIPLLMYVLPESEQLLSIKTAHARDQVDRDGFLFAIFKEDRTARSLLLWTSFFLSLLTMYLLLNWLPTLMISSGLDRFGASLVQLSFNTFGAMASFATGLILSRVSLQKVVLASFIFAALGIFLLRLTPGMLIAASAIGALVGITMSATQALLYIVAPANYPTEVRGTGVGMAVSIGRLGSVVGPLVAGVLLGSGQSPRAVLLILVPIILVAGAAAFILSHLMTASKIHVSN